jgi:hypothetical protein
MNIVIYDPTHSNHYLAINSIYKIYSCNPSHKLKIITNSYIAQFLKDLINIENENCELIIKENEKELDEILLKTVQNWKPDRLHIVSIDNKFEFYSQFLAHTTLYLSIHKFNYWFPGSISNLFNTARRISGLTLNRNLIRLLFIEFPKAIINELQRVNFIKANKDNLNLKFVGHGPVVYSCLLNEVGKTKSVHIPFSVYEKNESAQSENHIMRLGIPGSVEETRRKYVELFSAMHKELLLVKDLLEIYLIGKITPGSIEYQAMQELISKGFKVYTWEKEVSEKEFSNAVNRCHLIIGNLNLEKGFYNNYSETGVVFNMVRFAKPGFLPQQLRTYNELNTSIKKFSNYKDLCIQLSELIKLPHRIDYLIKEAKKNSLAFLPEKFNIS